MSKEEIIILVVSVFFGVLLLLGIIFFFVFPLIKKKYMYRNFKYAYYKKISAIAEINDYILVNGIVLKSEEQILGQIDHILLAKKYIYVIKDRYYRGAISGGKNDAIWYFFNNKQDKSEISNPMKRNEERIQRLCALTNINPDLIISLVVVNDDCVIKDPQSLNSKNSFIVSSHKLKSLIRKIEKRKVNDIDQVSAEKAMNDIYRLYGKGREE